LQILNRKIQNWNQLPVTEIPYCIVEKLKILKTLELVLCMGNKKILTNSGNPA